eukprot:5684106-Prymnesium_polylepis.2
MTQDHAQPSATLITHAQSSDMQHKSKRSQPQEDRGGWKHATWSWSRRCQCPARAERRLLRRRTLGPVP